MAWPKLLPAITVPTGGYTIMWSGDALYTTTLPAGDYESFLHLGEDLKTLMVAEDASIDIACPYSTYYDRVAIARAGGVRIVFSQSSQALYSMMGYTTVASQGSVVLAELRHLYGWYSPVGVNYPGTEREIPRRYQRTASGGAVLLAAPAEYKYRTLRFTTLLESHVEPYVATTDSDGYGNTRQWSGRTFAEFWSTTADAKFLYYDDADEGSFSDPGSEGDEFVTCVRTDERLSYKPIDDGYTYFDLELPIQIVGSN